MFGGISELYQVDWRIFMAGTAHWLAGQNPYGQLSSEFTAGAFAYPPTALPWLALFVPLGGLGFFVWTLLQLGAWWWLMRREQMNQWLLLLWSPMVLNLVQGQSTLAVVLVLWAATRATQRNWLWGLALAWALTKPQAAILPVLWMVWQDRNAPLRWQFLAGIIGGTLLLALPPTLLNPSIWGDWLASLSAYRGRILQMAAWQGPSVILFGVAAWLWYRSKLGGWQWWLSAGLFPHASFYSMTLLLPTINPPARSYWALLGIALAGILQGPMNEVLMPWIFAGHLLAVWFLAGGPPLLRSPASK